MWIKWSYCEAIYCEFEFDFRTCLGTVLSLGVNPIHLIKMSALRGDMIHIEEIYVCTLYTIVTQARIQDFTPQEGGAGGTDSPTFIVLVTLSSSFCASSLETQCIDA